MARITNICAHPVTVSTAGDQLDVGATAELDPQTEHVARALERGWVADITPDPADVPAAKPGKGA